MQMQPGSQTASQSKETSPTFRPTCWKGPCRYAKQNPCYELGKVSVMCQVSVLPENPNMGPYTGTNEVTTAKAYSTRD